MKKIILASGSPRRKEALEILGVDFDIIPSVYEEDMSLDMPYFELAKELAKGKAQEVANRVESGLVIGCDTFIAYKGKVIGKPTSEDEAKKMLSEFSGQRHVVCSGVAIIDAESGECKTAHQDTFVYFKELSDSEIEAYVASGEPMDKAGSYAIQGIGGLFVEKIEGNYSNVVGFPLLIVDEMLQSFGFTILEKKED